MAIVAPQLDYTVTIIEHITQTKQHTDEKTSLGTYAESSSQAKNAELKARFKLNKTAAILLPNEKIARCGKHIVPSADKAIVSYSPTKEKASYKNLERCESYACSCCGYVRSENDRHELSVAISEAYKRGWFVAMLTCTLRHNRGDALTDLRHAVATAFDDTFSGRWYQEFKDEWEIQGKVKAWETTYGKNGWHPHLHVLFFMRLELGENTRLSVENRIAERWAEKLDKLGYNATLDAGISLQIADSEIAEYIAKWGHEPIEQAWSVEHEIARAPVKKNRLDGLTPFGLLSAAAGGTHALEHFQALTGIEDTGHAKAFAGKLYQEYFYAFKGRPRLYWGAMREKLDMDVALYAYEQLNPREPDDSYDVVMLDFDQWRKVVENDLRAELLIEVMACDVTRLRRWLRDKQIKAAVRLKIEGREL